MDYIKSVPRSTIDNKPALVKVIIWSHAYPVRWRIYAVLGEEDLMYKMLFLF